MPALIPIRFGSSPEGTPLRPLVPGRASTSGSCVNADHAAAFLARTTGLNPTYVNAYTDLLDGMDAAELSCKMDVLHIYASQDEDTALLNLLSASYNGTVFGSPTFTAGLGFTGVESSNTDYIDTNFNAVTALQPNFVADDSHISAWSVLNDGGSLSGMIGVTGPVNGGTSINPQSMPPAGASNTAYFRCTAFGSLPVINLNTQGHFISNRTSNLDAGGYRNNVTLVESSASAGAPVENRNIVVLGENDDGVVIGSKRQIAQMSIGAGLTPTDRANFYTLLRTYMTAVGVP